MITEKKNPNIEDAPHPIDLNESAYQSRWRLMAAFQTIAKKEASLTSKKIKAAFSKMEKTSGIDELVKIIDDYIGDHIMFYWGDGDYDPIDEKYKTGPKAIRHGETKKETKKAPSAPKKKNYKTKKRAAKKTSAESLEENMRNSTVAFVDMV